MTFRFDNRWLAAALALATFAGVFISHTFPLGLSDFWWHLNTGRWIWEHGAIPVDDPFLFSSPVPLDARAELILRGYPLSQLLMLGAFHADGFAGLVLLKALLLTVFYVLLWNGLRRNGLHPLLALAITALIPLMFTRFDELRPQLFSFIGALLAMQLAEYLIDRARTGPRLPWHFWLMLPVTLLLWANLHRGFIIGDGLLGIYLLTETLKRKRGTDALPDQGYRRFLVTVLVSIAISLFNPSGFTAFWASFTEVSGPFAGVIDEFFSTPKYYAFYGMKLTGYLVMATALVPAVALLARWRQVSLAHALIVAAFLVAGILSFRFSLMMVAAVLSIASRYYAPLLNNLFSRLNGSPLLLAWLLAAGMLANTAWQRTSLRATPLETGVYPVAAVDYLQRAQFSGNIYNPFEYGGYLSWRLYPRKIFIDQRNLSWDVYEDYSRVWRGNIAGVFDKYGIGVMFYPVFDGSVGGIARPVAKLAGNPLWEIGYYDGVDIILFRRDLNPRQPYLDRQAVIADMQRRLRR